MAIEREQQQRKTLVEQMIRLLFLALEKKKTKNDEPSSQQKELIETILNEEAGTTELTTKPRSDIVVSSTNLSVATTTRTVWNRGRPLKLYWMWQNISTEERDGGIVRHSICKLGVSAEEGVVVEFSPPKSLVSALLSAEEDAAEQLPPGGTTAVCEVSNFEWRLKGSTKHSYVTIDLGLDDSHRRVTEDYIVRSSWKFGKVVFSMISESYGFAAEEVLLEGRDIALKGNIVIDSAQLIHNTADENAVKVATTGLPSIELKRSSKSALSLDVVCSGGFEGSAEEKQTVGLLLRMMVDSLDQLLAVPNLRLSVGKVDENGDPHRSQGNGEGGERATSIHEDGLGDALKHILRHHCQDDGSSHAKKQHQHQQHLKRLQQQSPQLFSSSKAFGAMVTRAARKAKARSEKHKEQRQEFAKNARGVFGSILKKQ